MSSFDAELKVEQLEVAYHNHVALNLESFALRGHTLAIVGHNGAGKSTLIKTILGLLRPRHGCLHVQAAAQLLLPERDMAFCPESGSVFADISVEEYIRMWCRLKQGDGSYYRKQGAHVCEVLQLNALMQKLGRELSKGQRRRVQTAIGFLCKPKLFLFDEPFDGLDVQKTDELAALIEQFRKDTAFIISSHRMEVVERLADKLIVLKHGKLAAQGPLEQVCTALCPESIAISGSRDVDSTVSLLRSSFPHSVVTRLGEEVKLAGRGLQHDLIKELLQRSELNGVNLQSATPSLMEAMNFYLRGV